MKPLTLASMTRTTAVIIAMAATKTFATSAISRKKPVRSSRQLDTLYARLASRRPISSSVAADGTMAAWSSRTANTRSPANKSSAHNASVGTTQSVVAVSVAFCRIVFRKSSRLSRHQRVERGGVDQGRASKDLKYGVENDDRRCRHVREDLDSGYIAIAPRQKSADGQGANGHNIHGCRFAHSFAKISQQTVGIV